MPGKSFSLRWLRLALRDMHGLADFLAEDDPETAKRVVALIWEGGNSLCRSPERGRPGRVPGTRELVLQNLPFFLAYRVKGAQVDILRVVHTSRQWPPE